MRLRGYGVWQKVLRLQRRAEVCVQEQNGAEGGLGRRRRTREGCEKAVERREKANCLNKSSLIPPYIESALKTCLPSVCPHCPSEQNPP